MTFQNHPAACLVCGTSDWRPHCQVRGVQIVRCRRCGLCTWDWPGFDPQAFYAADYWKSNDPQKGYADYLMHAAAMGRTHRQRLHWLARHLGTASGTAPRLLDAGCGPGFFVQSAANFGWSAEGVEVSTFAVEYAQRELGVAVRQGQIRADDLPPGPFDIVTLWDVIEHLPTPQESLTAVHAALRPGGVLALSTGDIAAPVARLSGSRWHLFNLPEHLWFFTAHSLRLLLERVGFDVVAVRYEICWYSMDYLAERLERKLQVRVPTFGLGRLALPATLADIVTIVARKRGPGR